VNRWDELDWVNINPNDPRYYQAIDDAVVERNRNMRRIGALRGAPLYERFRSSLNDIQRIIGRAGGDFLEPTMISSAYVDGMELGSKFISMALDPAADLRFARGLPFGHAVGFLREAKRLLQRMRYRDIPVSFCPLSTIGRQMPQRQETLRGELVVVGEEPNPIPPPPMRPIYKWQSWDFNFDPPIMTSAPEDIANNIHSFRVYELPDSDITARMQSLFQESTDVGMGGGIVGKAGAFSSYVSRGRLFTTYPNLFDYYYPSSIILNSKDDHMDVGLAGFTYDHWSNTGFLFEDAKAMVFIRIHDFPDYPDTTTYSDPPGLPPYTETGGKKYLIFDTTITTRNRKTLFTLPEGVIPPLPPLLPRNEARRNEYWAAFSLERVIVDENSVGRYAYKAGNDFA